MGRSLDAPNLLIGSLSSLKLGAGIIPGYQQQIHALQTILPLLGIHCRWKFTFLAPCASEVSDRRSERVRTRGRVWPDLQICSS